MILGIHPSVRKGVVHALEEAAAKRCRAVQIFPRPPSEVLKFPFPNEIEAVQACRKRLAISHLAVHSVFQPNIASTNLKTWQRSRDSFLEEYRYSDRIGADFLVIHSGSYSPDSSLAEGLRRSAETIRWVLEQVPSRTKIAIENVGGGERRMGGKFEELGRLLDEVGMEERMAVCLDTAHTFAAGYPIQTLSGLEETLALFDKTVGFKRLQLFHINDSGGELGSHKDIHEHIGRGFIGLESLKTLTSDPRFAQIAGILETPHDSPQSNEQNLEALRA